MILYLLFFAVQIFFNFDIAQKIVTPQYTVFAKASGRSENIQQDKTKSHAASKVRLNKRFQPSGIVGIFHDLVKVPAIYEELKPTALTVGNSYSFIFLSAYTLRGPPVIA
ncbi:MAG: hypothetical protein V4557_14930 [Bacteroidota bacterium]